MSTNKKGVVEYYSDIEQDFIAAPDGVKDMERTETAEDFTIRCLCAEILLRDRKILRLQKQRRRDY